MGAKIVADVIYFVVDKAVIYQSLRPFLQREKEQNTGDQAGADSQRPAQYSEKAQDGGEQRGAEKGEIEKEMYRVPLLQH